MLGISPTCLSGKIYNNRPFKNSEIEKLVHILCISDGEKELIFLPKESRKYGHTPTESIGSCVVEGDDNVAIGNRIRFARHEKEMTLEQLSSVLGITKSALSQYEVGDRRVSVKRLLSICYALDISPNYLFGWDEPSNQ